VIDDSGKLNIEQMGDFFKGDERYPQQYFGWLFELLNQFGLSINDDDSTLVLPSRFSPGHPDFDLSYYQSGLNFRLSSPEFLTKSVIAQFIIRMVAYIERTGQRYCDLEIEHYRPKKAVSKTQHAGYYWLCYEWSNLLPSCNKCNRDGGKHNQFPILGEQVTAPQFNEQALDLAKFEAHVFPLIDEEPLLLHPEIDLLGDYLAFEIGGEKKDVRLKGIDERSRGVKTIEICQLNQPAVTLNRQKYVIDYMVAGLKALKNSEVSEADFISMQSYGDEVTVSSHMDALVRV
jgi:hypothetical protein